MTLYRNGRIPPGVLFTIADGVDRNGYWEFQTTRATYVRWQMAKDYAEKHFGKTLYIRSGWNIYRPFQVQKDARDRACAAGNCNAASVAGFSSHGGNWRGRDCLAIDVDPNGLSWAQVWEACRSAGFECGLITQAISGIPGGEPWHIIDFNAFGPVPDWSGDGGNAFEPGEDTEETEEEEEEDMVVKNSAFVYDRAEDGKQIMLVSNTVSGWYQEYINENRIVGPDGNAVILAQFGCEGYARTTETWAKSHKASLVRAKEAVLSGNLAVEANSAVTVAGTIDFE